MWLLSLFGIQVAHAAGLDPVGSINPFASTSAILQSVQGEIIAALLGICTFAAVIYIILAGIQFIASNGDPTKTKKARDAIVHGVIGIVIIISAYAILNFIYRASAGVANATPGNTAGSSTDTSGGYAQPFLCSDGSSAPSPAQCPAPITCADGSAPVNGICGGTSTDTSSSGTGNIYNAE